MNTSINDPGQYRSEATSIDPGLIAVLFRLRDAVEQGISDLRAAGFTPMVFALSSAIDRQTAVYHDTTAFDTTEELGEKLRSLGLTQAQVQYFTDGVGRGELLLTIAAEGRKQLVLDILAPRGGDHGPRTSTASHDDNLPLDLDKEAAVSFEGNENDDVLPPGMRIHGS